MARLTQEARSGGIGLFRTVRGEVRRLRHHRAQDQHELAGGTFRTCITARFRPTLS
jgi:hypothetical protein